MKSYNHLWEKLVSHENIILAVVNASKGNMRRRKLYEIRSEPVKYVPLIRSWIEEYKPAKHLPKTINDGISAKVRTIIVPTVREHIVQHAVMNILKPILTKGMYEHSYASIPRRGCHKGMRTVRRWIRRGGSDIKYCCKCDVRKFFDSIDQDILIYKLRRKIRDECFMELLEKIIRTTKRGLPLGFYTSQWFANFYMQDFDHYVKETLRVKHYIRYMDDVVLFGSNKRQLHRARDEIEAYLARELRLTIKSNWQVFRFHTRKDKGRFLDFMGFRFYRNRTTLRRKIALKAMRKARRISKKKKPSVYDARQMLTYTGWTKRTDTYAWFRRHILGYVDLKQLRRIISYYDRKRGKEYVVQSTV